MCVDAMVLHVEASKVLSNNVKLKNSNIFNLEDMLLTVAASGTADCIFYCALMNITIDNQIKTIARYFEYGTLEGAFNTIQNKLILEGDALPLCIYTQHDVEEKHKRDAALFVSRRKGINRTYFVS